MSAELFTDIQKFAVNDGPGFRTNVFIKGCPLKCAWCHNPETISLEKDLFWKSRLCVQCGACLDACPRDAINAPIPPEEAQTEGSTYHKIIRDRCDLCMKCVDACRYDALEVVGRPMTIDEVLEEVEQDMLFYQNSGGGMTMSGGEPTMHPEFVGELLVRAREKGIHICLDTNGYCKWEVLKSLAEKSDIILYDLKHLDSDEHKRMTGVPNEIILKNLERLVETGMEVWVRTPILVGYNDSIEYHRKVVEFLKSLPGRIARIDLLPFHNWCQDKYGWLGIKWDLKETESTDPATVEMISDFYKENGLNATVGGSGFEDNPQLT